MGFVCVRRVLVLYHSMYTIKSNNIKTVACWSVPPDSLCLIAGHSSLTAAIQILGKVNACCFLHLKPELSIPESYELVVPASRPLAISLGNAFHHSIYGCPHHILFHLTSPFSLTLMQWIATKQLMFVNRQPMLLLGCIVASPNCVVFGAFRLS